MCATRPIPRPLAASPQLPNVANAFYYDALMSVILIAMIGFLALTFAVQFIKFFVKWYV